MKHRAILVEVLRNRFQAIVEEMGALILRAGHTVFVKETADFGAAIVSNGGEVAAAPVLDRRRAHGRHALRHRRRPLASAGRGGGRHLPLQRRARDRRHGHPPAGSVLLEAGLPQRAARLLRVDVHALLRHRRPRAGLDLAGQHRHLPGRHPHTGHEAVPARRREPGRPAPLHGQLPHPRSELGRPQGAGRGPQHGREADQWSW